MRKLMHRLVALDDYKWHSVTMQMSWHFRTGVHAMPPIVLAVFRGVEPTREVWDETRKQINAARRADKARESRYVRKQKQDRRRAYMRFYMRDYRKAHADA